MFLRLDLDAAPLMLGFILGPMLEENFRRALLLSPSVCLNVVDGQLQLGRWQRIFFVDLDGPQRRDLSVLVLGATGR